VEDQRVDGNLALSRAIGDFQYKDKEKIHAKDQAVSCYPDVSVTKRKKGDKYIVMACDGIWDCVTNEECCEKVNKKHSEIHPKPAETSKIVESLFDEILAEETEVGIGTDNMTCILIYFQE
jgi:protein phosphatase 2C family protein 2/3